MTTEMLELLGYAIASVIMAVLYAMWHLEHLRKVQQ